MPAAQRQKTIASMNELVICEHLTMYWVKEAMIMLAQQIIVHGLNGSESIISWPPSCGDRGAILACNEHAFCLQGFGGTLPAGCCPPGT